MGGLTSRSDQKLLEGRDCLAQSQMKKICGNEWTRTEGELLQAMETSTLKSPCFQLPQKENSYSLWSGTIMGPGHSLI